MAVAPAVRSRNVRLDTERPVVAAGGNTIPKLPPLTVTEVKESVVMPLAAAMSMPVPY